MRATGERGGAFPLARGSRDAAVMITLAPGADTAHVVANGGEGAGEGMSSVEVHEVVNRWPGGMSAIAPGKWNETGSGAGVRW